MQACCRKIFVVGCPRSGTTWVRDIFRRHPDVVTSAETALFDCLREPWWEMTRRTLGRAGPAPRPSFADRLAGRLERRLAARWPPWYAEWRPALVGYYESALAMLLNQVRLLPWSTLRSRMRRRLVTYRRLYRLIEESERQGPRPHDEKVAAVARAILEEYFARQGGAAEQILVEKTPSHLFHARFILAWFPEARVVEVVRDGRDVCVSMDAYKRWMPQDRKFQVWLWTAYVEEGWKLLRDPALAGRMLRVRYEDLHREPAAGVERILAFAELPAPPELRAQIVEATRIARTRRAGEGRHYRKGAVGDFKQRLSRDDLALFRRAAGATLDRLGYS